MTKEEFNNLQIGSAITVEHRTGAFVIVSSFEDEGQKFYVLKKYGRYSNILAYSDFFGHCYLHV